MRPAERFDPSKTIAADVIAFTNGLIGNFREIDKNKFLKIQLFRQGTNGHHVVTSSYQESHTRQFLRNKSAVYS